MTTESMYLDRSTSLVIKKDIDYGFYTIEVCTGNTVFRLELSAEKMQRFADGIQHVLKDEDAR